MHSLAVAKRAGAALGGEEQLAQRFIDDAGDDLVAIAQRDRDRPNRKVLQVVRRAVERIDDPCAIAHRLGAVSAFLTEADVIRTPLIDERDDRQLALAIGGRDPVVARQLLPERFTTDAERVRRFQREARAASALNHPNIITIYEVGEDDKRHFIATEYIEGQTLRDRIASYMPMTIAEVLDVAIGVCGALGAAHDAGILHRDIKPENIMLRPDGYVKVLDFGLAKLTEAGRIKDSTTGAVMGTLLYISPEQARGQQPD